jgi:hypothetical protein
LPAKKTAEIFCSNEGNLDSPKLRGEKKQDISIQPLVLTVRPLRPIGSLLTNPVQRGVIEARRPRRPLAARPAVFPRLAGLAGPPVNAGEAKFARRPLYPLHAHGAGAALFALFAPWAHVSRFAFFALDAEISVVSLEKKEWKNLLENFLCMDFSLKQRESYSSSDIILAEFMS